MTEFFSLLKHQALLLSAPNDIYYFVHFDFLVPEEREAFLLITPHKNYLIKPQLSVFSTDLVPTHLPSFFQNSPLIILDNCQPVSLANHIACIFEQENLSELLIDESSLFVIEYRAIVERLKTNSEKSQYKLSSFHKELMWQLRMIKNEPEVALIKKAAEITEKVMMGAFQQLKVGLTEKELADWIDHENIRLGAQRSAFPTIVAFGPHSALPHHQADNTPLNENTVVLIDMGAIYHHYRSDMTRTMWFGSKERVDHHFFAAEKAVREAYAKVFDLLSNRSSKNVITAKQIDDAARTVINAAGYGEYFIHTTGHGVGLDIHEPPSLNWKNEMKIEPGMVITIEPGIYLPDRFGYRYENTVFVKKSGVEELTEKN